jgi:hypothetical protein
MPRAEEVHRHALHFKPRIHGDSVTGIIAESEG